MLSWIYYWIPAYAGMTIFSKLKVILCVLCALCAGIFIFASLRENNTYQHDRFY